ncbi:MAG: methionine gamma-lyase family protein [Oscillospiraceae bacterium]|nr:methionine gamma-lyase family protein [Oscillospiraceae bacterium]
MAEIFDPKPVTVQGFEIEERILKAAARAEEISDSAFREIDRTARFNGEKVLRAFINNKVSDACLKGSTGYGYGDIGRDTLDAVFAEAVGAEDALVRHSIASGTHALTAALFGVLRTGDKMVSLTGRPYDTLEEVIGLRGEGGGSLAEFGIEYDQVDLLPDGKPDVAEIFNKVRNAKVAYIQRSRGYSLRPSLTVPGIAEIVKAAKGANPDVIVMVDNCYGEFVEKSEPLAAGADLIVGSLIKNPGGGIAPTGGYIAGRKDLVEKCSYRLTCPGVGREAGATLDQNKALYQGLFMAPETVANAMKTAVFTTNIMSLFGFETFPSPDAPRGDIITSVLMKNSENLIAFCKGVQKGSPIDSFVSPEPWDMPGYDSQVIMAAGTFNNGASIELSADAPLREPFAAYVQGGLTYTTGRMGILCALQEMFDKGCLNMTGLKI